MRILILLSLMATAACLFEHQEERTEVASAGFDGLLYEEGSWQYFLQHLPAKGGKVVDYRGRVVDYQEKAAAIINYDVGTKDLQQCADALIRLRSEYLFSKKRFEDIRFQFTSGDVYGFTAYCNGVRPTVSGNKVKFSHTSAVSQKSHESLRKYLDIIYTYAGTISLERELLPAEELEVGTVIIKSGSPGHCCIIIDEDIDEKGEKLYKLAEGYTPAQSIYVLKNQGDGTPWHRLDKNGAIKTGSYHFDVFKLKAFE